jgi:S1-C subfamily serine protease
VGTPSLDFLPGVLAPQVVKASAAYRAGVEAGDIILGINGEALPPSARSVRRVVDVIRLVLRGICLLQLLDMS